MRILKVLSILLVSFILIGVGINYWASQKILKKIESQAKVTCQNLAVNIFTKKLTIEQFQLEKKLPSKSNTSLTRHLQIKIPQLKINGCAYLHFLLHDELCLETVHFKSPEIRLVEQTLNKNENTKADTIENSKEPFLKLLKIDAISLDEGHMEGIKKEQKWLTIDTFFTKVSNFKMDFKQDSSSMDWEGIQGDFKQVYLNQVSGKNQVKIGQATFNTDDKDIQIHGFKWKPKEGKEAFMQDLKYRKARIDLEVPQLSLTGFSLKKLLLEKALEAKKINILDANLHIYSDKNLAECKTCYKPYFHEVFQDSPFKIAVDSILVKKGKLLFEMLEKGKEESGELKFEELYASIYQLKHKTQERTDVDIYSKFMGAAIVNVHFGFWLNSPNGDYEFNAEVNHFSLEKINPFLAYASNARIQKGVVNELKFNGTGHQYSASGDMQFSYNNLEIALFNKEKKHKKLLSKIINGLLVTKENPDGKEFHKGKMYFEREEHKSFISNWWKTVQSGFQSTMFPDLLLKKELKKE